MKARLASLLVPLATVAFGIQAAHAAPAAKQDRPNILLIMADDLATPISAASAARSPRRTWTRSPTPGSR